MAEIYGGVETGGTWVVCALGTGPGDIAAEETFATGGPEPTLERIAEFFERGPRPAAIGIGSFGPVADLGPRHQHPEARMGAHPGGAGPGRPAGRAGAL
jgi:fructokinase